MYRASPSNFLPHTFTSSGGGGLPIHSANRRTTVFQSAVRQLKNKYLYKFQQTFRSSGFYVLVALVVLFLVYLTFKS